MNRPHTMKLLDTAVIAIDIGGTTLKGAAVGRDGRVILKRDEATFAINDDALAGVIALAQALLNGARNEGYDVQSVGLASPGLVDPSSGTIVYAANLQWESLALSKELNRRFEIPVYVEHDARAGAIGERAAQSGDPRRFRDFVFIPIGTGVSAAVVTAGSLVTGATGASGEFGHVSVFPEGEMCVCGRGGCIEAYASATSIVARYLLLGGVGSAPQIVDRLNEDTAAAQVWGDAIEALARGVVSLVAVLDPAVVIIGGGLSRSGSALLEPLRHRVQELLTWRAAPVIQLSSLGSHAGLIGAANLAWNGQELPQTFTESMLRDLDTRNQDSAASAPTGGLHSLPKAPPRRP